jgi:hypothetical protein
LDKLAVVIESSNSSVECLFMAEQRLMIIP